MIKIYTYQKNGRTYALGEFHPLVNLRVLGNQLYKSCCQSEHTKHLFMAHASSNSCPPCSVVDSLWFPGDWFHILLPGIMFDRALLDSTIEVSLVFNKILVTQHTYHRNLEPFRRAAMKPDKFKRNWEEWCAQSSTHF